MYLAASKNKTEPSTYQFAQIQNVIGDRVLKVDNNFVFSVTGVKKNIKMVMTKLSDQFFYQNVM